MSKSKLFVSEKGLKTRKKIKDKSNDYLDELKSKYDEYCNSFAVKLESFKKYTENL